MARLKGHRHKNHQSSDGRIKDDRFSKKALVIFGLVFALAGSYVIWHSLAYSEPIGHLDTFDSNGLATGWACDADNNQNAQTITFYLDGAKGQVASLGATRTGLSGSNGDLCQNYTNKRFSW